MINKENIIIIDAIWHTSLLAIFRCLLKTHVIIYNASFNIL